jgi:hypothetical protein
MSKRIILTEVEKTQIKNLYNMNEQDGDDFLIKAFQKFLTSKDNSSSKTTDSSIVPTKTTPDDDFYKKVLSCVGAKPTKDNMSFMYAWRQAEGGKASNNPFNTTHKMPNSTKYNSVGVRNYKNSEDGIQATCKTLKNGRYNDIVNGLKNDVGLFELSRMKGLKTWGTGELLAKVVDGYLKGSSPKPQDIA